ncbi:hypothetical protein XELAEV_18046292mg, partial [Xenopus laevis]
QVGTGNFCSYCVHSPVPVTKSCLQCETSMCDAHVRVHSKSAEHVLTEPTASFSNRKCSSHKKLQEYYCCEDGACICASCCLAGEHRGHRVELLNEASDKKKEKLRNVLEKLCPEREETERGKVTALFNKIREQLEALEKRLLSDISRQKEELSLHPTNLIEELEIKNDELSRNIRHIEMLCNMGLRKADIKVPVVGDLNVELTSKTLVTGLAGIVTGVKGTVCGQEDADMLLDKNTAGDASDISDIVKKEMVPILVTPQSNDTGAEGSGLCAYSTKKRKIPQPVNKKKEQSISHKSLQSSDSLPKMSQLTGNPRTSVSDSAIDTRSISVFGQKPTYLVLDTNTVGNEVSVSGDRKMVSYSHRAQCCPQTRMRFQIPQALSTRSFKSGQHYWEVEGSESGGWMVGVAYPSIERGGKQSTIGNNKKSWCLYKLDDFYTVIHDSKGFHLSDVLSCRRIGISLDYDAGSLSFYELSEPVRHLHTFKATFTGPLHAAFCVWIAIWVKIIN